mmetsp:Transcript_29398/g.82915  ORF Transcript_29398/g.82915 Transcript_29398/m.82915 type:complete len:712 (-) Transcript_29398:312-2447(-)
MNRCWGCKYVPTLLGAFQRDTIHRVLDLGTGSCEALRQLRNAGLEVVGVESVSFPLEDKCQDLLEQGIVQKAPLDKLPFEDGAFDMVLALHVLEFIPHDALPAVLAEIHRVARLRAVVTVVLPDKDKPGLGGAMHGITAETLFPAGWWSEKLAANGLSSMANRQRMMVATYKAHRARDASPQDGIFAVAKEPAAHSLQASLAMEPLCLACDYMPLVYYIYNPPGGVGRLINLKLYQLGDVAVFSPTACNIIRGMEESKPGSLKSYTGYQMDPFTMERDCPELVYSGAVMEAPPVNVGLQGTPDSSLDLVMLMYQLEALEEEDARALLREARRVAKRHVFILVMACGTTGVLPKCEAHRHPWVNPKLIKPTSWWLNLFKEEGFRQEALGHIFRERQCLPEEIDPKFPERTTCPSWYQHFRYEGSRELIQDHIFALEKIASPAVIIDVTQGDRGQSSLPADAKAYQQAWHPKLRGARTPPTAAAPAFVDPQYMKLPSTVVGRKGLRPPAPRTGTLGQDLGYSWKGVSQVSEKDKQRQEKMKAKAANRAEQARANSRIGKRQRPEGSGTGMQERLLDKKMEIEGGTEEHRQRRDDRIQAAQRAKVIAQRGTDEELPVEDFLAKHGIQGGSIRAHEELKEKARLDAIPESEKFREAERQRLQRLGHTGFDRNSLQREFGALHQGADFPKQHISYSAHGANSGRGHVHVTHQEREN